MADSPDQVQPLRGPLGWRELFFTRRASPILAYVKIGTKNAIALVTVAAVLLGLIAWLYAIMRHHQQDVEETFAFLGILTWIGFEALCVLSGLKMGWLTSVAQCRRRISDLTLTELRPIEICQWLIASHGWTMAIFVALLFGGTMLIHAFMLPRHAYLIVLIGAIGLNTALTYYMTLWVQTALFISAPSKLTAFRRQFVFFVFYALIVSLFVVAYYAAMLIVANIRRGGLPDYYPVLMVLLLLAPFWWMKYRIAKAWAERIERAIFYQLEM